MRNWSAGLLLAVLALMFGASCGGDDDGDGDDGAGGTGDPGREACVSPGTNMNCTCVAGGPMGTRHCDSDMFWSACTCPEDHPDRNGCDYDGQRVLCDLCPGETERRMTTCMDNTFDCSCSQDGGTRDGG
jgi:hypothetical protein